MNWQTLIAREPELAGIERSARACRQQAGTWYDFESEHGRRVHILASRWPTSRLRAAAMRVITSHLMAVWCQAMLEPPAILPWDSRPSYVGGIEVER